MYKQIFTSAGLTPTQAEVFDFLLKNQNSKASFVAKKLNKPRGVVYKSLEELMTMNLVSKKDKSNMVSTFFAEHPGKIEKFFSKQENRIKKNKAAYLSMLPDMMSVFNLNTNKPNIRFYEGDEGIKYVIHDTLKTKTKIYTFVDVEALKQDKVLNEINAEYVKIRKKRNIKKRIITSQSARKFYENSSNPDTEIRFIKDGYYPFKSGMQIYDNKVSFQTIDNENKIAIIIEDENIYKMHKLMFEYIWENLKQES